MTQYEGHALEYDDVITKSSEFIEIPPGEYPFTVEECTKTVRKASDKNPECPAVSVKLKIAMPDGQTGAIYDTLTLWSTWEWKLSSFFESIGLKNRDEPLQMNWKGALGKTGRCKIIKNGEYTNIKEYMQPKGPVDDDQDF